MVGRLSEPEGDTMAVVPAINRITSPPAKALAEEGAKAGTLPRRQLDA